MIDHPSKEEGLAFTAQDFLFSFAIFAFVLIAYRFVSQFTGYPVGSEWQWPMFLAFGLGATPVVLRILMFMQRSGASFDLGALKVSFPAAAKLPAKTIPKNLDPKGQAVPDSGDVSLREIANDIERYPIVIIDLGEGIEWYVTRLFAIVSSSLLFNLEQVVVFVATEKEEAKHFLGYSSGPVIALSIMKSSLYPTIDFKKTFSDVAANLYGKDNPGPLYVPKGEEMSPPALFIARIVKEFQDAENEKPWITKEKLLALLGTELKKSSIEQSDTNVAQLLPSLRDDAEYVALLEQGKFLGLLSVVTLLKHFVAQVLSTEWR